MSATDHPEDVGRNALTERIIKCAIRVSDSLGCGFLEKVYENAMVIALREEGLAVRQQVPIKIHFSGYLVGEYIADLIVEEAVLLELKTVRAFDEVHSAMCINYLKATGLKLCLMINFAKPKLEIKRFARDYPK